MRRLSNAGPGNLMFSNEPVKGKPTMKNTLIMIDEEENLDVMLNEQPDNSDGSDVFLSVPPNMNGGSAADILAYCLSMYPDNDVSFYQGPLDFRPDYVDNTISLVVTRERLKNANVSELVEYIRRHYPEYALQLQGSCAFQKTKG